MKTVYTAPKLLSLGDNGIKDFLSVADYLPQLRLVQLTGVPVRIELNKDKYVEVNSEEEEIDLSAYNKIFEELFGFFYGTAYLYGFVDNNKLSIYDIFTNDNYFSTRDLLMLEAEYKLPIVKPIVEGTFTFAYLIEVLNKKINGENLDWDTFHLLPSVYVDDNRTYPKAAEPKIESKVILGEKKTYTPTTYYYNSSSTANNAASNTATSTTAVTDVGKTAKNKNDVIFVEIFKDSDKKARQQIFDETLKNVNAYVKSMGDTLTEEQRTWFTKNGKFFTYLYSILTLPETRDIVYDYCVTYVLNWTEYAKPIEVKWAYLFVDLFKEMFSNLMEQKKVTIEGKTYDMVALFFKEEFIEFDKFFVKETNKADDWRYGENLGYGGIY